MQDKARIFCPACEWRPGPDARWQCIPSCGTVWNTFWTRGVCPGCSYRWTQTQCPACDVLSPHEAWYHEPPESEENTKQDTGIENPA